MTTNKKLTTEEMDKWEALVDEEIKRYLAKVEGVDKEEEQPYNILLRD